MSMKIFLAATLLCTMSISTWAAEDSYKAPDLKLSTKSSTPQKMKGDDWDTEYRVNARPVKTRGVASEPDAEETVAPMRYPSSVDENGVHKVKEDEQPVAPIFWKYKSDF